MCVLFFTNFKCNNWYNRLIVVIFCKWIRRRMDVNNPAFSFFYVWDQPWKSSKRGAFLHFPPISLPAAAVAYTSIHFSLYMYFFFFYSIRYSTFRLAKVENVEQQWSSLLPFRFSVLEKEQKSNVPTETEVHRWIIRTTRLFFDTDMLQLTIYI